MSSPSLPPADWYDDPEKPGWRRFWDGSTWTSDRHPVPGSAPPAPPSVELSGPSEGAAAVGAPASAANATITCPVCGRSDMLQNIGVILDQGTSTTQGRARTTTAGSAQMGGMASDLTLYSGSATTSSTSTTRSWSVTHSQLASRFLPPRRPRPSFLMWFLVIWLGSTLLVAVIFGAQFAPQSASYSPAVGVIIGMVSVLIVTFFVMWIPALVVALIIRAVSAPALAARRKQWDRRTARLRGGYFCARDGVAVDDGRASTPEEFRQLVFSE